MGWMTETRFLSVGEPCGPGGGWGGGKGLELSLGRSCRDTLGLPFLFSESQCGVYMFTVHLLCSERHPGRSHC